MTVTLLEQDLVGIGFGPANLALAVALHESGYTRRRSAVFLEGKPGFSWHEGMLLPDARMQISFLKDLVSTHDPTSTFSFLNYLHTHGRLRHFINQKNFFPSRMEFHGYLTWAAGRLAPLVRYDRQVSAIEPVMEHQAVTRLRIVSRDVAGRSYAVLARAVVVGTGAVPHIPPAFAPFVGRPGVLHTAAYLPAIAALPAVPRRIAVVGGGQSAAEAFLDLHARFPAAALDLMVRGFALRVADDSPFVNEIFEPETTDLLYGQPEARREQFLAEFRHTNYAAIDDGLLRRISELLYQQRVAPGDALLRVIPRCRIVNVAADAAGCAITVRDDWTHRAERRAYDLVVLATGYDRETSGTLLAPLVPWLPAATVGRDYRLSALPALKTPIFLQGGAEQTHGIADSLLSLLPVRAQAILAALDDTAPPSRRGAHDPAAAAHGNCLFENDNHLQLP